MAGDSLKRKRAHPYTPIMYIKIGDREKEENKGVVKLGHTCSVVTCNYRSWNAGM